MSVFHGQHTGAHPRKTLNEMYAGNWCSSWSVWIHSEVEDTTLAVFLQVLWPSSQEEQSLQSYYHLLHQFLKSKAGKEFICSCYQWCELPSEGIEYITVVEGNAEIGTRMTFPFFSGWYFGKGSCCMWFLALFWKSGGSFIKRSRNCWDLNLIWHLKTFYILKFAGRKTWWLAMK